MRIERRKCAATARRTLSGAILTTALSGFSLAGAGSAAASTVLPENPDTSCSSTVHGAIGDTVAITGSSVADLVKQGANKAKEILVLSELAIWDDHWHDVVAGAGTLTVGTVQDAQKTTISGEKIASTVVDFIRNRPGFDPGLGFHPDKTLGIIADTIAKNCGLTVVASNYTPPTTSSSSTPAPRSGSTTSSGNTPVTPNAAPSADPSANAGGAATNSGWAPRNDYSDVPAVPAPPSAGISMPEQLSAPPKASVPQPTATFDLLGPAKENTGKDGSGKHGSDEPKVRQAGSAETLSAAPAPDRVQLPMLLAVVALALVTAALVRTWVMRRMTPQ